MGLHSPLADSLLAVSLRFRTLGQTLIHPTSKWMDGWMDGWMDHKPVSSQSLALPTPSAFLLRLQTTSVVSSAPVGVTSLGLDPSSCLYPEIQSWDPENSMSLEVFFWMSVQFINSCQQLWHPIQSLPLSLRPSSLLPLLLFVAKWTTTHVTPRPLLLPV